MKNLQFAWEPYVSLGQKRIYQPKTTLYRQGEVGNGFYYLQDGEVKIKLISNRGDERVIDFVAPGELFGEQGIKKEPYFTSAFITKPSTLYYFSNESFQNLCKEQIGAVNIFLNSLINKERLLAQIVSLENRTVEQKLAFFLLKLYDKHKNNQISINQISLSLYIGTSRITIYKILQQWEKSGIVSVSNRTIHIHEIDQLQNIYQQSAKLISK